MQRSPDLDLGLRGYDELFMNQKERVENRYPKVYQIPIREIDDFPDHPFKVKLDEDMDQLVESIKEQGVITPVILRKKENRRYELVSGHRRRKASELAGLETVPAEIRELTKDEAVILMVESNLQRSVILPSEKAFSYKMRMEAMKRMPGRPTKLNGGPVGHHLDGQKTRDILAEESADSARQIQRYIRLTELIPDILNMVDEGKIALRPAVEISYLTKTEQKCLADAIEFASATPSHAQAIKMRNFSKEGKLTPEVVESIMCEEKPNQREKINLNYSQTRKFIPESIPYEKTADYIYKALEYYKRHLERSERGAR